MLEQAQALKHLVSDPSRAPDFPYKWTNNWFLYHKAFLPKTVTKLPCPAMVLWQCLWMVRALGAFWHLYTIWS